MQLLFTSLCSFSPFLPPTHNVLVSTVLTTYATALQRLVFFFTLTQIEPQWLVSHQGTRISVLGWQSVVDAQYCDLV